MEQAQSTDTGEQGGASRGMRIEIERPTMERMAALGVLDWNVCTKPPSTFQKHYDKSTVCYVLEGEAIVHTEFGDVRLQPGDMITFPVGLDCTWSIQRALGTHYSYL